MPGQTRGPSSRGYRWRNHWLFAPGCHELDEARGSRGGPWPSAQPSVQARDVQGRSGRDMLQVGLSEADVARAAQATEPDALRQAALDPGTRAVERPPLRRVLSLAHGLDGLVSALTPKRQRARRRLGSGAQRTARAGAAGGLGEADVHGAGAPGIVGDHPGTLLCPCGQVTVLAPQSTANAETAYPWPARACQLVSGRTGPTSSMPCAAWASISRSAST